MNPIFPDSDLRRNFSTRFGQIMKCVWGVKLLSLWCLIHVIGSQATTVVTPYLDSPRVSSRRQRLQQLNTSYGTGVLPDHSARAQASHRGLERPSELQLDSSSVSPMLLGTIRGYYLHPPTSHGLLALSMLQGPNRI
jgi:hypothetical protein